MGKTTPPSASLLLRVLGGGYLVYLAWDMRSSFSKGLAFVLPAVVFAVVGATLAAASLWHLARHEYFRKDPEHDEGSNEDQEESNNE